MAIKHSITFSLRPAHTLPISWDVQMDVEYDRHRFTEETGVVLNRRSAWNSDTHLVNPRYYAPGGMTGLLCNRILFATRMRMESAFRSFEDAGIVPEPGQLLEKYRIELDEDETEKETPSAGIRITVRIVGIPERLKGSISEKWIEDAGREFNTVVPFVPAAGEYFSVGIPGDTLLSLRVRHRNLRIDACTGRTEVTVTVDVTDASEIKRNNVA